MRWEIIALTAEFLIFFSIKLLKSDGFIRVAAEDVGNPFLRRSVRAVYNAWNKLYNTVHVVLKHLWIGIAKCICLLH